MLTFFFIFRLRPRLLRCHACGRCMCACVCWAAVMTCAAILLENSQSLYLPESCGGEMNRRFISGNVLFFLFFFLPEWRWNWSTNWVTLMALNSGPAQLSVSAVVPVRRQTAFIPPRPPCSVLSPLSLSCHPLKGAPFCDRAEKAFSQGNILPLFGGVKLVKQTFRKDLLLVSSNCNF